MKKLLFSVTKKDLRIDTFRVGGHGGQHKDKKDTGVRITHIESGAAGECREERSQLQNKKKAFQRMVDSDIFQTWVKKEAYKQIYDEATLEKKVDNMMREENLKIEYGGNWEDE